MAGGRLMNGGRWRLGSRRKAWPCLQPSPLPSFLLTRLFLAAMRISDMRLTVSGRSEVASLVTSVFLLGTYNLAPLPRNDSGSFSVSTAELFTPGEAGMRSSKGYFSFVSRWTPLLVLIGAGEGRQGFWNERLTLYKTISLLSIASVAMRRWKMTWQGRQVRLMNRRERF